MGIIANVSAENTYQIRCLYSQMNFALQNAVRASIELRITQVGTSGTKSEVNAFLARHMPSKDIKEDIVSVQKQTTIPSPSLNTFSMLRTSASGISNARWADLDEEDEEDGY